MKCDKCGYEWENRKRIPKACPRCKKRFDYPIKEPTASEITKNFVGFHK